MSQLKFRDLKADEIDVRLSMVRQNGVSLLLYKDARCDMNILDETVGAFNWQRIHTRENANCIVSIWDSEKAVWVSKEDTGTESNTEKEKGLASDSFKRACFNWGIGRELYTAPFIWVPSSACDIKDGRCYDKFSVLEIEIKDKRIVSLTIANSTKGVIAFSTTKQRTFRDILRDFCQANNIDPQSIVKACNLKPDSAEPEWAKALEYAKKNFGA